MCEFTGVEHASRSQHSWDGRSMSADPSTPGTHALSAAPRSGVDSPPSTAGCDWPTPKPLVRS